MSQQIALMVDDSMLTRHTVRRFLEQHGFSVASATNGLEAMQILATVLPRLYRDRPDDTQDDRQRTDYRRQGRSSHVAHSRGRACRENSAREMKLEGRADYVIYKDIDIECS